MPRQKDDWEPGDLAGQQRAGRFTPGTFDGLALRVVRPGKSARASSFFGTGCVAHGSMAHPVSPRLRIHLAEAAMAEGISVVRDGTYVFRAMLFHPAVVSELQSGIDKKQSTV